MHVLGGPDDKQQPHQVFHLQSGTETQNGHGQKVRPGKCFHLYHVKPFSEVKNSYLGIRFKCNLYFQLFSVLYVITFCLKVLNNMTVIAAPFEAIRSVRKGGL